MESKRERIERKLNALRVEIRKANEELHRKELEYIKLTGEKQEFDLPTFLDVRAKESGKIL